MQFQLKIGRHLTGIIYIEGPIYLQDYVAASAYISVGIMCPSFWKKIKGHYDHVHIKQS